MERAVAALLLAAAIVYGLFAVACFRLAVVYGDDEFGLSVGEGLFTLLGAVALGLAARRRGARAVIVTIGTVPLVGWFLATPWNSGPPFLVASLLAPAAAAPFAARGLLASVTSSRWKRDATRDSG